MGLSGDVLAVEPQIAAEWWAVCSDASLTIEIIPPLDTPVPIEFDGFGYRRGIVSRGIQSLAVLPSPGRRGRTSESSVGSSFIVLSPRSRATHQDDLLLCFVRELFVSRGATLIRSDPLPRA